MRTGPHRVALTGGIATGKSYVATRFRLAGVPVVDADQLAREVVRPGTEALAEVRQRFGDKAIAPSGEMNRQFVAGIVFRDPSARHDLEAIVHPRVRKGIDGFFSALPAGTPFAIADIPLLYEMNRSPDFDAVVVAACGRDTQIARVMARDGLTREDAERRVDSQLPIEQKAVNADYVVRTDRAYEDTNRAVDQVLIDLRRRWS